MFNKYFRAYPYWLQLLLFMLMTFTMVWFFTFIMLYLSPKITGVSMTQIQGFSENSPKQVISAAMFMQLLSSIGIFMVPALLFAYLAHPHPAGYLGLRKPGKPVQWLLVILIMLGAMPVFLWMEGLLRHLPLSPQLKQEQEQNDHMMNAFLNMNGFADFLKVFAIMAIVPAVGEELFFRGIILRFAKKKSRGMVFTVIFTGLIFALSHLNVYGFPAIFLAGVLLCVIYYLTGSLWCSILAHMLNNGLQIILLYMASGNTAVKAFMESNSMPAGFVIGGAALFVVAFYLLLKNKTPLPLGWALDYTAAEFARENDTNTQKDN